MYCNVLKVFHDVLICLTMVSESCNDWHCRIGDRADRLRDSDNAAGIIDNAAEIGHTNAGIGYSSAEIGDIATKLIPW